MRLLRSIAMGLAIILSAASSAQALPVTPTLSLSISDGTESASWEVAGTEKPDGTIDYDWHQTSSQWDVVWDVNANPDPAVSANASITNNTLVTNTYTVIATFPLGSVITPTSITGGSVQGGFSDNNGNGVTVSTAGGSPLYLSQIDGVGFKALYAAPTSGSAGSYESGTFSKLSFGAPIPSFPGPAAFSEIGIQLKFTLTPGDTATFSSVFVVEPVPEASTFALGTLGGLTLLAHRLRRRVTLSRSSN